jgi:hypothetical protein
MKKSLNNAMMKKFETMVAGADDQADTGASVPEPAAKKAPAVQVTEEPVVQPVKTVVVQAPSEAIPAEAPVPAVQTAAEPVQVVSSVPTAVTAPAPEDEHVSSSRERKVIPLTPEEKSSGVLHIRLGELRSYVDFITQFNKTSYQQYISSLIEQDYEQHKDTYMKYREFMEQFHM